jgi:restriction system protein
VQDLNAWERVLLDWLGRRSFFVLATLPILVFVAVGAAMVTVVSAVAHRSPIGDLYVVWIISAVFAGALALYVASFYVLAAVFIRSRRFKLLEFHQSMREIQAMSWQEFEDLVGASYQAKGYDVEPLGGDRPDGGVDLVARKDDETWLVQCKHYRNRWVDVRPLRELLGVVTARKATGGILVTCGVFDERALAFAKETDQLELIGGEELQNLIAHTQESRAPEQVCPMCGSRMRQKSGRFGKFLGCVNWPACKGWRPLEAVPASSGPLAVKA